MTATGRLGGLAARLGLTEGQVWTSALGLTLGVALLATSVPPVWERRGEAGAALAAPLPEGAGRAPGAAEGEGGPAAGDGGALDLDPDLGDGPGAGPAPADAAPVAPPGAAFPDLPPGPGDGDLGAASGPSGTSDGGTSGGGASGPSGTSDGGGTSGGGPSGSGPGGNGTGGTGTVGDARTGVLRVREGAWSSSAPEPGVPDGGLPLGIVLGEVSAVSYVRLAGSGAVLRLPLSTADGASYGTPPTRARACRITDARWTAGPDRDPVPFDPADCASAALGPAGLTVDLSPFADRTGRAGFALLVDPGSAPPPVRSSRVVLAPAPPS